MITWLALISALSVVVSSLNFEDSGEVRIANNGSNVYAAPRKCMDHLGCFEITSDFYHPRYRPINVLPFDREFINVRFKIFTKKSGKQYQHLPALKVPTTDVNDIQVNPDLDTKVMAHGWLDNQVFWTWMEDFKDDYYKVGDYNIITVDWSGGNLPPYTQAVANTRVVGAEIALLINKLVAEKGLDPRRVHLMGHSLGGQVIAYAGERIKNLGRITGLDPAAPFYQWMPPSVRIDPTDAELVEIIHTDTSSIILDTGLGMIQVAGNVDFFPNNGKNHPGCTLDKRIVSILTEGLNGVATFFICAHNRAVLFFKDSITNKCPMVHVACPSYETYLLGKCIDCGKNGEKCAILGERSIEYLPHKNDSRPVKMFARTNSAKPFCLYHYQIQIQLQFNMPDQDGTWFMTLTSGNGYKKEFQLGATNTRLHHGASYTYLWSTLNHMGDIKEISIRWRHKNFINIFKKQLFVERIKVTPATEIDSAKMEAGIRHVCATNSPGIDSGKSMTFTKFSKC